MATTNSAKVVLIIAGPTGAGKSAVAIDIAKRLGTEIISADSRQCYEGMSIGTAQPTAAQLSAVSHHFINAFPVTGEISAARYETLALSWLNDILMKSDHAVVCGGTGLYIRALTDGLDPMPPVNDAIAAAVETTAKKEGLTWLQDRVEQEDPLFWSIGERDNRRRLSRALAFMRSHGSSIVEHRSGIVQTRPFRFVKVYLDLPRNLLYERINHRVEAMMEAGLEKEARALFSMRGIKNLDTVGYRELFDYFEGKMSRVEAVEKIKQHSRNYAKRQGTWFRKEAGYVSLQADDPELVGKILALLKAVP